MTHPPALPVLCLLLLCSGCIVSQSEAPVLRQPATTDLPSVGLRGFTGETMDVSTFFGAGSSSYSGTVYGPGGSANYYGTGSSSHSGVSMSRRETAVTLRFAEGTIADLGFPMPQHPDYIIVGTYKGPGTDYRLWYADAAVDIFSLTFLWNVRQKTSLDIRVFDAASGKMLTKISELDSYRFTTLSLLPLYGHLFVPMQWPNHLYPRCNERVTIKALNRLTKWLENNPSPQKGSCP